MFYTPEGTAKPNKNEYDNYCTTCIDNGFEYCVGTPICCDPGSGGSSETLIACSYDLTDQSSSI